MHPVVVMTATTAETVRLPDPRITNPECERADIAMRALPRWFGRPSPRGYGLICASCRAADRSIA
jgi:hypothetical protein